MTDAQDDAYNATGYELRKGMSLEQVRWEFKTSRERLNAAIAAAPPEALDVSLYGAAGVRSDHEQEHAGWIRRWRSGDRA